MRIAQVVATAEEFPVRAPLAWIDCADNVKAETHYLDPNNSQILAIPVVLPPTADELEAEVQAALNGGSGPHIDMTKLLKAKFVSDLAWRLGKAPGALTGAELTAERNRIAAIYKAL